LPEDFKVNDVAFHLQKEGYCVTVITAVPDYPRGEFFDGYGIFKKNRECVQGVEVIRLPIIPRGNGSNIRLIANYASYFLSSLFFTAIYSLFKKFDLILVHMTSPVFIGVPAVIMKKLQKIPLLFWVLDLWPESVVAVDAIKGKHLLEILNSVVCFIYKNSDRILVSSESFSCSLIEKGVTLNKIVYFPNWSEDTSGISETPESMQKLLDNEKEKYKLHILFMGNIGKAQNIEFILDVVSSNKETFRDIKFVFIGDGRNRQQLMRIAKEKHIEQTCVFPGRFPLAAMPSIVLKADVLLLTLKDELIFRLTVPAKLQFYMSQGKPVLGIINGESARIIEKSRCGIIASPNDPISLLQAIEALKKMPKKLLYEMGENGKQYYISNFSKEKRMNQLKNIIETIKG
jgi:glycosyltransferase involved in cell wall biosynthesis